jgi:hypothetical protein
MMRFATAPGVRTCATGFRQSGTGRQDAYGNTRGENALPVKARRRHGTEHHRRADLARASERRQRARIAAFALHSQGKTSTAAATAAFLKRFEDQVDPQRLLSEAERQRRALAARRAHMARLALRSVRARRR